MLSLHKLKGGNAGEIVKYVTEADYYSEESTVQGRWHGAGCDDFGLQAGGAINLEEFKNLLSGFDKDGDQLTKKPPTETHSPGLDMTFSSPKSVSLARSAASPETRDKIDKVIAEARMKALDYATERGCFVIRKGHGGEIKETARPIFAMFSHHNSRAHDPQEHYHVIAINAAIDEYGQGYRIDMQDVWRNKLEIGAIMRAHEARALQEAGFTVERDGSSYRLVIPGITKDIERIFSKGSEKIAEEAGPNASAKSKEKVALNVRGTKTGEDPIEADIRYKDEIFAASGVDAAAIEAARAQPQQVNPDDAPRFDMDEIIDNLAGKGTYFRETHLRTAIAVAGQGVYSVEEIEGQIDRAFASGRLIEVKQAANDEREIPEKSLGLTTIETFSSDRELDRYFRETGAKSTHAIDKKIVDKAIADFEAMKSAEIPNFTISDQQRKAIDYLTQGGDFAVVEGVAGAGKSTFLYPVARAAEAAGYKVYGVSFQNTSATDLGHDAEIESYTIDKFTAMVKDKKINIDAKTLIIIDESGQVGGMKMQPITRMAEAAGAKLILSGDTNQKQAIVGTAAMKLAIDAVGCVTITETQRQRDKEHGEALTKLRGGEAVDALVKHAEAGKLHIVEGEGFPEAVEAYREAVEKSGVDRAFILTDTNAAMRRVNTEIRRDLKSIGVVAEQDYRVQLTDKNRNVYETDLSIGDRIITRGKVRDEKAIQNGIVWRITDIEQHERGLKIGMERADGAAVDQSGRKRVEIDTYKTKNFHLAYGMTVDLSQGKTKDLGGILSTNGERSELTQWYVGLSRFKEVPHVIISEHAVSDMAGRRDVDIRNPRDIAEAAPLIVAAAQDASMKKSHTLDKSLTITSTVDRDKALAMIAAQERREAARIEAETRREGAHVAEMNKSAEKTAGEQQQRQPGGDQVKSRDGKGITRENSPQSRLTKTPEEIEATIAALRLAKTKPLETKKSKAAPKAAKPKHGREGEAVDQEQPRPQRRRSMNVGDRDPEARSKPSLEEMTSMPARQVTKTPQDQIAARQAIAEGVISAEAAHRAALKTARTPGELQHAAIERDHARLAYRGMLPASERTNFDERTKIVDQISAPALAQQKSAAELAARLAAEEARKAAQRAKDRGLSI